MELHWVEKIDLEIIRRKCDFHFLSVRYFLRGGNKPLSFRANDDGRLEANFNDSVLFLRLKSYCNLIDEMEFGNIKIDYRTSTSKYVQKFSIILGLNHLIMISTWNQIEDKSFWSYFISNRPNWWYTKKIYVHLNIPHW